MNTECESCLLVAAIADIALKVLAMCGVIALGVWLWSIGAFR